jgi:hypothetical protein
MEKRMVVVTTDKKGVFFGELLTENKDVVELANAKMCIYWCSEVKGVLGLASVGAIRGCRISPAVPKIKLNGVTAIMDCTDKAVENWEKETWN